MKSIGIREDSTFKLIHPNNKLAHYAKACTDITFKFPFGTQELMGIAARGNFDLTQHSNASGKMLEYLDSTTNAKYIPHVIEPSIGIDRLFLAILTSAYREEIVENELRVVLGFKPNVAPIKAAVLPLLSNRPELTEKAKTLYHQIKKYYQCEWDSAGAIGRRYRRADEGGIPFCITVDFDSLSDDTVTIRDRDSMVQTRMKMDEIIPYLRQHIED